MGKEPTGLSADKPAGQRQHSDFDGAAARPTSVTIGPGISTRPALVQRLRLTGQHPAVGQGAGRMPGLALRPHLRRPVAGRRPPMRSSLVRCNSSRSEGQTMGTLARPAGASRSGTAPPPGKRTVPVRRPTATATFPAPASRRLLSGSAATPTASGSGTSARSASSKITRLSRCSRGLQLWRSASTTSQDKPRTAMSRSDPSQKR